MSFLTYRLGNGIWGSVEADNASRILNDLQYDSEEAREDTPTALSNVYSYRALAVAGSATSSAVWNIVRITYDANGLVSRVQYRANVAWDSRTSGWS